MIKASTDTQLYGYPYVPLDSNFVETDRLGSVRAFGMPTSTTMAYLPYADQMPGTQNQSIFATYYLDGNMGLHYADQRFY